MWKFDKTILKDWLCTQALRYMITQYFSENDIGDAPYIMLWNAFRAHFRGSCIGERVNQ